MTKKPLNSIDQLTEAFGYLFEPPLIAEIDKFGAWYSVPAQSTFIDVGQSIPGMPLLLKGSLKIMREDEKGDELLLYYIESGDTCAMTLTCCMRNSSSQIRAVVEEDALMVIVPTDKMEEWIVQFRSWRSFVLESYNNRLNELLNAVDSLAFKKLDERLWNYLVDKVKITSSTELHITHNEIADELNSSRVVISRLLKQLENSGKIKMHRNSLEVIDF
jgi:CRP/FNR family transcriptional regulator, anaerobic regulatory protein